ncbi:hypothetical protein [Massilia scottii]|uniref:hypothetical protein n=1 Tax=Massilia scottii TaxID=3057166 RepID=UPI0027969155|nr:hypothetical protein [Massilia sp. CCM 9029]MDQ1832498.1 hypothetical protein [Massilia sp. CCM 9029]
MQPCPWTAQPQPGAAADAAFNVGQTYDAMVTQGGKQFEVALTVLRASPVGQVLVS